MRSLDSLRPPRSRRGIALGLAGALALLGCRGRPEAPASALQASAPAERSTSDRAERQWVGVVVARDEVDLTAPHDGRLAKVDIAAGERVAAGRRLAAIAAPAVEEQYIRSRAAAAAAESEVQRATLLLRYATATWERRRLLGGLVSAQDLALAERDRDIAAEALAAARVSQHELAAVLASTAEERQQLQIRAPADAWVARVYFAEGASVAAGQAVIRLRSGRWLVRFAVPPVAMRELTRGSEVLVREGAVEVVARLGLIPSEIDSASGMTFVEADLPEVPWQHGQAVAVAIPPRRRGAT